MPDWSTSLILFPCSASKNGPAFSYPLERQSVTGALGPEAAQSLLDGRRLAFERPGVSVDGESRQVPALALYTGNPYKVPGFVERILNAQRAGAHCLILSGGYGLVAAGESIHSYKAHMQQTAQVWRPRLAAILADYVERQRIERVFICCSSAYARVLGDRSLRLPGSVVHWCVPNLAPGEGGAMVKIPKRIGEVIVRLVGTGLVADAQWRSAL